MISAYCDQTSQGECTNYCFHLCTFKIAEMPPKTQPTAWHRPTTPVDTISETCITLRRF